MFVLQLDTWCPSQECFRFATMHRSEMPGAISVTEFRATVACHVQIWRAEGSTITDTVDKRLVRPISSNNEPLRLVVMNL